MLVYIQYVAKKIPVSGNTFRGNSLLKQKVRRGWEDGIMRIEMQQKTEVDIIKMNVYCKSTSRPTLKQLSYSSRRIWHPSDNYKKLRL